MSSSFSQQQQLRQRRKPTPANADADAEVDAYANVDAVNADGIVALNNNVFDNSDNKNKKPTVLNHHNESFTLLPPIDNNTGDNDNDGNDDKERQNVEVTKIPTAQTTKEERNGNDHGHSNEQNTERTTDTTTTATTTQSQRLAMSGEEVKKDEHRFMKIWIRFLSGCSLISVFMLCIYTGHIYVCGLVALSEFLVFRELVKVRYNAYFHTRIENTIPLFRTTQWMWFTVAIFYTYGDFISEVIQSNTKLHSYVVYSQYLNMMAFTLYSGTFVVTIATLQVGHIKFQLNQLCWTLCVLCLTVGQMKYIMHNIFNGLFWFAFPLLLVVCNDVMAYFCGISCGRKFIQREFMSVSPNKTWEGFIGGGIFTMIFAWYFSRVLAQYTWMTCPVNDFDLFPSKLECDKHDMNDSVNGLHHIFVEAQSIFPHQIFELLPNSIVKMIPGIVEICSSTTPSSELIRCISGEESHTFHHFELIWNNVYPIQIHALWLGFFASVVAPFGGFLASAIKRAYGIKDFDSIIPGHGGVTDRLDCQFLMALCTWVHYNSFCRLTTISVSKLVYHYNMMSTIEKRQFLAAIVPSSTLTSNNGDGSKELLLQQFQDYALS